MDSNGIRLQKYMAMCGVAARRKCEQLIAQGLVSVNGVTVDQPGCKVHPHDTVMVRGEKISLALEKRYVMLNKPSGYLTTVTDPFDRKTVMDLIDIDRRIVPVGRLDKDTSGLLLLTDDGDFAHYMTHPSHEITKEYVARIAGRITQNVIAAFHEGIVLEDGKTSPAVIRELDASGQTSHVRIVLHEGKKRQVKRMLAAFGHETLTLERVRIGNLYLGNLTVGHWRELTQNEIKSTGYKMDVDKNRKS